MVTLSAGEIPYVHINPPFDHGSLLINVRTLLPNVMYDHPIAEVTLGFSDHAKVTIELADLIAIF